MFGLAIENICNWFNTALQNLMIRLLLLKHIGDYCQRNVYRWTFLGNCFRSDILRFKKKYLYKIYCAFSLTPPPSHTHFKIHFFQVYTNLFEFITLRVAFLRSWTQSMMKLSQFFIFPQSLYIPKDFFLSFLASPLPPPP